MTYQCVIVKLDVLTTVKIANLASNSNPNMLFAVTHAIKSASTSVIEQPSITELHSKLHKRCDLCMKCVSKLREAMDGGAHMLQPTAFSAKGKPCVLKELRKKSSLTHVFQNYLH